MSRRAFGVFALAAISVLALSWASHGAWSVRTAAGPSTGGNADNVQRVSNDAERATLTSLRSPERAKGGAKLAPFESSMSPGTVAWSALALAALAVWVIDLTLATPALRLPSARGPPFSPAL